MTAAKGSITDVQGTVYPSALRPTAYWNDGSIKWLFVRGMVDLPKNVDIEIFITSNEYDYPHACALMYARTGIRRYMDYVLVSGRHWMDIDICQDVYSLYYILQCLCKRGVNVIYI